MEKISGALAIGGKIPLIFDTSGLNKLLRDPDRAVLVAGLKCGYQVRLTANSISEIAAYSDSEERNRLLDLCCMFLDTGLCLHAFHIIIRRLCSRFDPAARLFDWNQTDARCRGCEDEIVRRQFIKDEISAEELSANQEHDATFK